MGLVKMEAVPIEPLEPKRCCEAIEDRGVSRAFSESSAFDMEGDDGDVGNPGNDLRHGPVTECEGGSAVLSQHSSETPCSSHHEFCSASETVPKAYVDYSPYASHYDASGPISRTWSRASPELPFDEPPEKIPQSSSH